MTQDAIQAITFDVTLLPDAHELRVVMTIQRPADAASPISVRIPTWVPGDYRFVPQARDLFGLTATDAHDAPLTVARDGWQGWTIAGGTGTVTLQYTASAQDNDMTESAGYVQASNAIVLGPRYLYIPGYSAAVSVSYHLPEPWANKVHCPEGPVQIGPHAWRFDSYEQLVDTPIVFGDVTYFPPDGDPFEFVFVDTAIGFDTPNDTTGVTRGEQLVAQVRRAASTFGAMFGGYPFERYTFILSCSPANDWGLEHLTSTMCGLDPEVFVNDDTFATAVRVCAHELFHAWNVRRLRPQPLNCLGDRWTSGAFTDGLWVAEGFTRYYEFLASTRAQAYTASQFFSNIVGYDQHLTLLPAYGRVTAEDASYASYLNHGKYDGCCNNSIDYYDKGMLIAFMADVLLRKGGTSLDAVFAGFYRDREPQQGCGYTDEQVFSWFEDHGVDLRTVATQPRALQTATMLGELGLEAEQQDVPLLGVIFRDALGDTLGDVLDNSAAAQAGLAPGDVLTAINGFAYTPTALTWMVAHAQTFELTVLRGHLVFSVEVTPTTVQRITALRCQSTPEQLQAIEQWLGHSDLATGTSIPLAFYENFHGIDVFV